MFGRKLDMVCSTHPYGKEVRYSSAPKREPAMDGATWMVSDRDPGSTLSGNARLNAALPLFASDPPFDCENFTPGGFTGRSSWRPSDSSSVSALPVIVTLRTAFARTRQSSFISPRVG